MGPRPRSEFCVPATGAGLVQRAADEGELVSPVPADAPPPPTQHFKHGEPTGTWIYRDASGAEHCRILRFDFPDGRKEFCPLTLWRNAKGLHWRWKAIPAPRPLYGLDRLASRPDAPVIVSEGEKSADAATRILPNHVVVTSSGGSQAAAKSDWSPLSGRKVTIWPDNDESGANYANEVAAILTKPGCEVSVIDADALAATDGGGRGSNFEPIGWDAADAISEWPDPAALRRAALGLAKPVTTTFPKAADARPTPDEAAIERRVAVLSVLTEIKYAVARTAAAKELHIPVGILDRLVKAKRPQDDPGQGRAITFPVIDPWPHSVDGAAMLGELVQALRGYVILSSTQADAIALWVVFTHVHDAFDVSPRLAVKSPQKRSGKTTLFSALARVVARPRGASGITPSALLRLIELHGPTMLLDEMDALMGRDKEMGQALRGLMNSGFNRDFATFTMNVATRDGGYEPREFSTWCPLALAGIGELPETVRDRSIEIEMKRDPRLLRRIERIVEHFLGDDERPIPDLVTGLVLQLAFVTIFVGKDRADLHTSCHPAWVAEQEAEARGCAWN